MMAAFGLEAEAPVITSASQQAGDGARQLARIAWSVLRHNTAFDAHRVDVVAI
jgi:hypothetical protein